VLRPLFLDFPGDPAVWDNDFDFMLGDGVLVCPVTEPGVDCRDVALPLGADWRDGWTGETFKGGVRLTASAPYDRPPFFLRVDPPSGAPPFGPDQSL
jgi:alpha-D-xyloside xylohydrolase